jgi:hypothetical protein
MSNILYKTLTVEELKKDYPLNHGFIFQGNTHSPDSSLEKLCNTLITHGVTSEYPQFVVRLDNLTTVFVYGDDFNSPLFCQNSMMANHMGICKSDTLCNFLKNQNI